MEGWEDRGEGGAPPDAAAAGALDLDAFDSAEELELLGEAQRGAAWHSVLAPAQACCGSTGAHRLPVRGEARGDAGLAR